MDEISDLLASVGAVRNLVRQALTPEPIELFVRVVREEEESRD